MCIMGFICSQNPEKKKNCWNLKKSYKAMKLKCSSANCLLAILNSAALTNKRLIQTCADLLASGLLRRSLPGICRGIHGKGCLDSKVCVCVCARGVCLNLTCDRESEGRRRRSDSATLENAQATLHQRRFTRRGSLTTLGKHSVEGGGQKGATRVLKTKGHQRIYPLFS